jgi:hypothetical protein
MVTGAGLFTCASVTLWSYKDHYGPAMRDPASPRVFLVSTFATYEPSATV